MEAAEGQKASAIANKNGTVKKIFRARKTMTASCRQQIATLNKLKNYSKIENFVEESTALAKEDVQQQQTEFVLVENCIAQSNTSSEREKSQSQIFSNGFKTPAEIAPGDTGLKIGYALEGMLEEQRETCEHSLSGVISAVGSSANLSHVTDNTNNVSSTTEKTQFNASRQDSSSLGVIERGKLISEYDTLQDIKNDSLKTKIDNCFPVSKELSELPTVRTINEDGFLKMKSATGLVTPLDVLDIDSTNAAVPSYESNTSCDTPGTSELVMPNFIMNFHVDAASHNLSQGCNITSGDCLKKRTFSGDDVPEAKRSKIASKTLLDEIDSLIQRRIKTVFKESFDQRIQDLSQQINLIQCKEDNTKKLTRHLETIRRLARRIKKALKIQNEKDTQSRKLPSVISTYKELPQQEAANHPAEETSTYHTEFNFMQNLNTDCSNLVVLSDNETEQQREQGQIKQRKNLSKKVDHSAIRKIMESIKEHRNRSLSSRTDEQSKTVIDLTDDEEQKADRDLDKLDATYPSPSPTTSSSHALAPEDKNDENLPQKCSDKKEMLSESQKNEHSYDVTLENSSGHKSVRFHDSVAYLEISSNPEPHILKPPQKPELRLAQVQNPKGIALSWNITHADPSCAPAQVYCLYVHQENPNNSKKLWKKIGEIKALPLPMACTLTQFVDDATYSFVLRAKDACGRFGPLCDIQSTTLKFLKENVA
ncbi:activating transcription factor 7-interacting protein 2 [Mantella aurantiaca]